MPDNSNKLRAILYDTAFVIARMIPIDISADDMTNIYYLGPIRSITAHGGYREYLHNFKLDTSLNCPNCDEVLEDSEHIFFPSPKIVEETRKQKEAVGEVLVPENLMIIASIQNKLQKAEEGKKRDLVRALRGKVTKLELADYP